jgi:GWxTD domain-containing protein
VTAFLLAPAVPATAQALVPDSVTIALRQAVAEYDSDNPVAAEPLLRAVLRDSPAAFDPALGSASLWLGTLLWEQDRRTEAIQVWHRGWFELGRRGLVDLWLADRFVWGVFEAADEKRFSAASGVYLDLLENLEAADSSRIRYVAARILVPLRLVLPDSIRKAVGLETEEAAERGRLAPGAGRRLARWWRGMDGLPATQDNERLIEHLLRVATVKREYDAAGPRGFDDRGSVYIRFGPPSRTSETRLNPFDLGQSFTSTTRGIRTELSPTVPSFRRNEFWVYPAVSRQAQFLFIEGARGEYRLGSAYDLIPSHMWLPRYARLRLKVLEMVLRDLALYHPLTYSAWYEEVATYITDIELSDISDQVDRLAGRPGLRVPLQFAPRSLSEYYMGHHIMEEERALEERDGKIPVSFFDDFGELQDVRVALRTARFLNADGSTRVEMYWTAPTDDFAVAHRRLNGGGRDVARDFLVDVVVAEYDSVETRREIHRSRSRVADVRDGDDGIVYPQVMFHHRLEEARRLAVQWDVTALALEGETLRHRKVGLAIARLDSLQPLTSDRRVLEMSDLKPMLVSGPSEIEGPVFPGSVLTPDVQLGLQFEVYHLTFGPDDQTRYRITYEMQRNVDPAFRSRAQEATDSRTITASSLYEGGTSREQEVVLLDLSEWDSPGALSILVRVRDENSGQEVVRGVDFDLSVGD